jgi:hypothetical protein
VKEHRWYLPSLPLTVVNVTKTVSFILMVAAIANIAIVKVAFEVHFIQIALSITSAIVALGMASYVYRAHKITIFEIYVSLVSAGLWFTQVAEVLTATGIRSYSRFRQTGFYLAFALLSAFLYYVQRIVRESHLEKFTNDTGVPIDGA